MATKAMGISYSEKNGFQRLGIHKITLKPGQESSLPHAESHEEEFVYVLSGNVDAWINGYIYPLKPGHAAGFKAGTGIGHSFINNSNEEVELLVAGERTKAENRCRFLVDPDVDNKIPWPDAPPQKLGPHSGIPGEVKESEYGKGLPDCIKFSPELEKVPSFQYYSGDNEKFGTGPRLTENLGLEKMGIWHMTLHPGMRSSWPHAHTHEEEFVYILKGEATLWLDGNIQDLKAGDAYSFTPMTGHAHCLINNSDEPLEYICIGEAVEFPDEKIYYPLHPLRNLVCKRHGWLWEDVPKHELGPHNAEPQNKFKDHLRLELCTESHLGRILSIFEASPEYFRKVDGMEPSLEVAKQYFTEKPSKPDPKHFKEFFIIQKDGEDIGVVELHGNNPKEGITYLGLLLIHEDQFGSGLGRKCYELAEDYVRRGYQHKMIRLGVSDENDVSPFWRKMGFAPNGDRYEWQGADKKAYVTEFEKTLA